MSILKNRKNIEIKSFGIVNTKESHAHERNKKSILLNKVIYDSSVTYEEPVKLMVKFVGPEGNVYDLSFGYVYSIDYWPKDKYFEVQTFKNGEYIYYQILKEDVIDVFEIGTTSIRDLFPMSTLKPLLKENLNNPYGVSGYKLPRGNGKSRAILSRLTGMDCFDLEPGHIPEISVHKKEEPKKSTEEVSKKEADKSNKIAVEKAIDTTKSNKSSNNYLKNISTSLGTLSPAFNRSQTSYILSFPYDFDYKTLEKISINAVSFGLSYS